MARNLYDQDDRHLHASDGWLYNREDKAPRALPMKVLVIAMLLLAALGLSLFTVLPDKKPALQPPPGVAASISPLIILDIFHACDSIGSSACVVSPDQYRYRDQVYTLADISTPRLVGAQCAQESDLATKARHVLVEMLNGGAFEAWPAPHSKDENARLLMRDGVSLGSLMIMKGVAKPWSASPIDWCALNAA